MVAFSVYGGYDLTSTIFYRIIIYCIEAKYAIFLCNSFDHYFGHNFSFDFEPED